MFHVASRRIVVLPLLCAIALAGCRPGSVGASAVEQAPAVSAAVSERSGADQDLTDAARLLAGLQPSPAGRLAAIAARPEWRAWQREFDTQWTQATKDRFAHIADWRDRELEPVAGACSTLMYPFSGPDILNALLLFPDCERYVLFGLEQPGSLPPLDQLSSDRLARLLEETRHALNDLLARNYFITRHMLADTAAEELRGTLPLMAIFLVRMNAQLLSARDMEITDDGGLRPRTAPSPDHKAAPALQLVFARPGHAPQTVVYFRAQAEDTAINHRPGVVPFLERQAPFATFLKSASYLLHGPEFGVVRNVLLKHSRLILEDDSGIPLRYLKSPEWTLTLYGKYTKPVKAFNYGYQPDMAKAYLDERKVKPLTLSFGYHWAEGSASVILAIRTTGPVSPPEKSPRAGSVSGSPPGALR
jgi:hypothetical protein